MNIFTIENMKHILPGDWVVLAVIGVCIFLFFKYRVPAVRRRLCLKMDEKDCLTLRLSCQTLLVSKLEGISTLLISKIDGLDEKFTGKIEDVKELIRKNGKY